MGHKGLQSGQNGEYCATTEHNVVQRGVHGRTTWYEIVQSGTRGTDKWGEYPAAATLPTPPLVRVTQSATLACPTSNCLTPDMPASSQDTIVRRGPPHPMHLPRILPRHEVARAQSDNLHPNRKGTPISTTAPGGTRPTTPRSQGVDARGTKWVRSGTTEGDAAHGRARRGHRGNNLRGFVFGRANIRGGGIWNWSIEMKETLPQGALLSLPSGWLRSFPGGLWMGASCSCRVLPASDGAWCPPETPNRFFTTAGNRFCNHY